MSNKPTEINEFGTQIWRNSEGEIHRDGDLPAWIGIGGPYIYYQNGKKHRENNLPAEIYFTGDCYWYYHGQWIDYGSDFSNEEIEEFKKPYQEK